jgi:hypothetical protein
VAPHVCRVDPHVATTERPLGDGDAERRLE